MKAEIIYFSATKTTERIIKAFAEGLACDVRFTDITSLENRVKYTPAESGIVIIAAPVYGERIPSFVMDFITQIDGNSRPLVGIAVYGNIGYGISLYEFSDYAVKNRFRLIAASAFIGEHTYASKEGTAGFGRPNENDLKQAKEFGKLVREKCNMKNFAPPAIPKSPLPKFITKFPDAGIKLLVRQPNVDFNVCTRCGLCTKSCPFEAIDPKTLLVNEKDCRRCYACVKCCPKNARTVKFRLTFFGMIFRHISRKPKENRIFL